MLPLGGIRTERSWLGRRKTLSLRSDIMAFLPTFTVFVFVCSYLGKVLAYDNSYYDNVRPLS